MACFIANTRQLGPASVATAKAFDLRVNARVVPEQEPEPEPVPESRLRVRTRIISRLSVSARPKSVSVRVSSCSVQVSAKASLFRLTASALPAPQLRARYVGSNPKITSKLSRLVAFAASASSPSVSASLYQHECFGSLVCPVSFGYNVILDDGSTLAWDDGHYVKY